MRRRFFVAVGHAIHGQYCRTIPAIQIVLGLLIGFVEGWPIRDALYFTSVTRITMGNRR